jgi:hypothetical protein
MIRDFLDHLLWEVRISHYETTHGSKTNPELTDQLERFQKKRQTVGLLFGVFVHREVNTGRLHAARRELRQQQIRALEGLMPLFEEALICAKHPKEFMSHSLGPEHLAKDIADMEEETRRLKP